MRVTREWLRRASASAGDGAGPAAETQSYVVLAAGSWPGIAVDATLWPTMSGELVVVTEDMSAAGTATAKVQESQDGLAGWADITASLPVTVPVGVTRIPWTRSKPFIRGVITVVMDPLETVAVLALLASNPPPLAAPGIIRLGLWTGAVDRGLDTVLADLTRPALDPGNPRAIDAWGTSFIGLNDRQIRDATRLVWRPSGAAQAGVFAGWYVDDGAPVPSLLGWDSFAEPFPLVDVNSALSAIPRLIVGTAGAEIGVVAFNG